MNRPLFSVITPVYNSKPTLQKTLDSVFLQPEELWECIVVDGGSADGTVDLLRREERITWVSEPDNGIYDAMNKGIRMASGSYLYFLGAGDSMRAGVLSKLRPLMPPNELSLVYGNVCTSNGLVYDGAFTKSKLARLNICHQAALYGRKVFELLGCYNTKYCVYADHEFNIRCLGDPRIQTRYVNLVLADYEPGGFSSCHPDTAFLRDRLDLIRTHLGTGIFLREYARHLIGRALPQSIKRRITRLEGGPHQVVTD